MDLWEYELLLQDVQAAVDAAHCRLWAVRLRALADAADARAAELDPPK